MTPNTYQDHPSHPQQSKQRNLILGSSSAYRHALLSRLQIPFEVIAPEVDESPLMDETPHDLAARLALKKALAVSALRSEAVVIGSDQVAELEGSALGKPGSHERAIWQLHHMRGKWVKFHTAVAVVCAQAKFQSQAMALVSVKFRPLSDQDIEHYLAREQPYDCAGSAKSEGLGISLLDSIQSDDPTALTGLPLIRTCQLLRLAGIQV
jgi:septum formation protein